MEKTKQHSLANTFNDVINVSVSEATLWGRLLDPVSGDLSPEAARYLLNLQFPIGHRPHAGSG